MKRSVIMEKILIIIIGLIIIILIRSVIKNEKEKEKRNRLIKEKPIRYIIDYTTRSVNYFRITDGGPIKISGELYQKQERDLKSEGRYEETKNELNSEGELIRKTISFRID